MLLSTTLKLQEKLHDFYNLLSRQPWEEVANWLKSGNIITTGVGKSGYVARKVASTFCTYGIPAHFVNPTEAVHGELGGLTQAHKIMAFTMSGATAELQSMAQPAWLWYENAVILTAAESPQLPHRFVLRVPRVDEPVPVVGAIVLQLLGDGIAIEAARLRGFSPEDLATYHPANRIRTQT